MKLSPFILIACVTVLVVITVFDSGCMDKWQPDEPVCPVTDTTVYPNGYTGNIIGSVHYDVMICDGIDTKTVTDALQYIPSFYDFSIVQTNSSEYLVETCGNRIGMHIPLRDNLLVVCKGDPAGNAAGAAYITSGNGHRICAAVYEYDNAVTLGTRIYHEALHAQSHTGDADDMNTEIQYNTICKNMVVYDQTKYYTYLLAKDRGDL